MSAKPPQSAEEHRRQGKNLQLISLFYVGRKTSDRIFGVTEVFETYRLLQTVLFLTDSVFRVLFAYFDASMASIKRYEP